MKHVITGSQDVARRSRLTGKPSAPWTKGMAERDGRGMVLIEDARGWVGGGCQRRVVPG